MVKSKSLFSRSLIVILIPLLMVSILILLSINYAISSYFENESYASIKSELERLKEVQTKSISQVPQLAESIRLIFSERIRPTNSARITYLQKIDGRFKLYGLSNNLIAQQIELITQNSDLPNQGKFSSEGVEYYFVVEQMTNEKMLERFNVTEGMEIYFLGYISESYSIMLSNHVMIVVGLGLIGFLLIVAFVIFVVFRHIGKRLKELEHGASEIGNGRLDVTLSKLPRDEIGRLGEAMESMGKQLQLVQSEQADEFQAISHELKTPIMVMSGFVDAMKHGQYPSGSFEGTIDILEDELNKLNNLVANLLMLSKIQYMSKNNIRMENISLNALIQSVFDRLSIEYPEVLLIIEGEKNVVGDYKSWWRIIENIMTNQLRHCKSTITVDLRDHIIIANNGSKIDDMDLVRVNEPFYHGEHGQTGLGLSIIKNTLKLYQMKLIIENQDEGVAYKIVNDDIKGK